MARHKVRKSRWRTDEWVAEGRTQDGRYYFEYFPTQQAALRYANAMVHLKEIALPPAPTQILDQGDAIWKVREKGLWAGVSPKGKIMLSASLTTVLSTQEALDLAGILTACKSLSIRRQVKNRKLHDH